MISLIKNELYKLFHKKATIIVLIITVLFQILTNYIYSTSSSYEYFGNTSENKQYLEEQIKDIENNNGSLEDLVSYKSELDIINASEKYKDSEWKQEIINSSYYELVNNYYTASIITKDKTAEAKYLKEKDEYFVNLDNDNWQYFAQKTIKDDNDLITSLDKQLAATTSKIEQDNITIQIESLKHEIELEEYRLNNDVGYTGYLSDAIRDANAMYSSVLTYNNSKNENERDYLEQDVKSYYENKYILDNKTDVNNESTLQGIMKNLYDELSFMIFVFVIMISGSIVSEEFNKGTIKNLLTIPHTRSSILLSKYITVLLMIPFIVLFIFGMEFIIGGLFFGFSSLDVPVINYVVSTGKMSVMSSMSYYFLIAATKIPIVLLLGTLAFSLSVLLGNTAFSIAITFCGYIGAGIINSLAMAFDIKFLNYFVTTNWDYSVHLFGGESMFGLSITHSIIVCLVYYFIMLITDFIFFKKKNIKNI